MSIALSLLIFRLWNFSTRAIRVIFSARRVWMALQCFPCFQFLCHVAPRKFWTHYAENSTRTFPKVCFHQIYTFILTERAFQHHLFLLNLEMEAHLHELLAIPCQESELE